MIYLRCTASISPYQLRKKFFSLTREGFEVMQDWMSGDLPVWQVVLDLEVAEDPLTDQNIKPYFHSAAPTRRSVIESGVLGSDTFERASNGVSVGKSCSQLNEHIGSHITTETEGGE
jgi:hypothetical protein